MRILLFGEFSGLFNCLKEGLVAFMGHRTKRFFQWSGKMGERF